MVKVSYEDGINAIQNAELKGTFEDVCTSVWTSWCLGTWPEGAIQATVKCGTKWEVIG